MFFMYPIITQSNRIRQKPSDRHRPPDPHDSNRRNTGKCIGQNHPGSQGNDREYHGHSRSSQSAVQSIQQKQAADTAVKSSFDMEIAYAFCQSSGFTDGSEDGSF